MDDVAIIPKVTNQPEVDTVDTLCAGIVLEEDATLTVLDSGVPAVPYTLYVIGPGDLDGDGISDIDERNESLIENFDADGDLIPNFDEINSDFDPMLDACEFTYIVPAPGCPRPDCMSCEGLHPYKWNDPMGDNDCDGVSNIDECTAGTNPTDFTDVPVPMPVASYVGLALTCIAMAVIAVVILRKSGKRTRKALSLFLLAILLGGGFFGMRLVLADGTVDFANGDTIPGAGGGAIDIRGDSVRPWNGRSTYVTQPAILTAIGGPVYLGGMRTTVEVRVLGEGIVQVVSTYTGGDHPSPVSETVVALPVQVNCFLGERLTLTGIPDADNVFQVWTDDASSTNNPLGFQVAVSGLDVLGVFGAPGPDLLPTSLSGAPSSIQAGDPYSVTFEVQNIGDAAANDPWSDGLFLSRDAVFDSGDFQLLTVQYNTGPLGSAMTYQVSFSDTSFPDVAPGVYSLLGVADVNDDVAESRETNNTTATTLVVLDANLAQ
jgi:hypothetical protein